jgi:SET and MYND domain-containing protein
MQLMANTFSLCDLEGNAIGAALYLEMAMLNHSCEPNCCIVFEGSQAVLRTLRVVEEGEELTISYLSLATPREDRRWVPFATLARRGALRRA